MRRGVLIILKRVVLQRKLDFDLTSVSSELKEDADKVLGVKEVTGL